MNNPPKSPVEFELVVPESDEEAPFPHSTDGETRRRRFSFAMVAGPTAQELDEWPETAEEGAEPTLQRLHHSIRWYHLASLQATRWYTTLKVVQIVAAVAVPVLVATSGESFAFKGFIAALGGLIVILEGVLQLKQYSRNAVKRAQVREALKRQYFLYEAHVEPYDVDPEDRLSVAEPIERIVGRDVADWAEQPPKVPPERIGIGRQSLGPCSGDVGRKGSATRSRRTSEASRTACRSGPTSPRTNALASLDLPVLPHCDAEPPRRLTESSRYGRGRRRRPGPLTRSETFGYFPT